MPTTTKTKPKPAARSAEPKEKPQPQPESPDIPERINRWNSFKAQAEHLQESTQLFHGLEAEMDIMAVLALIELFRYGSHDGTECAWTHENAPNWLGCFMLDILLEVVRSGPKEANASPEFFAAKVEEVLRNVREAIEMHRAFGPKLPVDMLERLDKISTATAGANQ